MKMPDIAGALEQLPLLKSWITRRRLAHMGKALLALSPLHQEVFRLVRFEGMSVGQAAQHLQLPSRRVRRLLTEVIIALADAARR